MKRIFFSVLILIAAACIMFAGCAKTKFLKDGEEVSLWESFEEDLFWHAIKDTWNDNDGSMDLSLVQKFATDGKSSLECIFQVAAEQGATYVCESLDVSNWSGFKGIGIDYYNDSKKSMRAAVALCTGEQWIWQETLEVVLAPGWNYNVRFDFLNDTMKSAASNWENTASLVDGSEMKRVVLKFWGMQDQEGILSSSIFVDNLRIIK